MAVFAVVNRKGGTGKSTLATHIAAYLAGQGHEVMLGDVDRQQSSRLWLGLRPETRPPIHGWTIDDRNFARPPAGVKHVVLDTPGGFQGIGLMKVAMYADAILIPATPSLFDRRAAADCIKELRGLPRVQLGKCRLASVGMRIDGRTRNAQLLETWAGSEGILHLGTIKEAQIYARCLEQGLSMFDFPRNRSIDMYLSEWGAITGWVDTTMAEAALAPAAPVSTSQPGNVVHARPTPILKSVPLLRSGTAERRPAELADVGPETPAFLRA
ncbi:MAG: ParA family protein [Burkholderiales bacterium]